MEFFLRSPGEPARLGILPGAFNPVTIAHMALARAAAGRVDEVLWVLPRALPHKEYTGASFPDRLDMLRVALAGEPRSSIAASSGGLFVEIAAECRAAYGEHVRLAFLCGRDAAERIAGWDYGQPGEFARMLRQFDLLVAARQGEYQPPAEFQAAIHRLPLAGEFEHVSASEVRARIARGEPWKHLVPAPIHDRVSRIYRALTGFAPGY
jgi:nicotinate-nucleotide adenylyltransferase